MDNVEVLDNQVSVDEENKIDETNEKEVPKDAAAIIINAPQKDFNENDAKKVTDYLKAGGKAIIVGTYSENEMPNFMSILDTNVCSTSPSA